MSTPSLHLLNRPGPPRRYRFGPFELDDRAGELRKHGIRIRLRQQTLQILHLLLENPGEVVLRDEIRKKLWPDNTVVEFDHSINAAIQKLRDVLGDSADNPRYIETLTRRGYRLLVSVEVVSPEPAGATPQPSAVLPISLPEQPLPSPGRRSILWIALVVLASVIALAGWIWPRAAQVPVRNWTLSLGDVEWPTVSPDGSGVLHRIRNGLALRRLDSIGATAVYDLDGLADRPAWSADGSHVVFRTVAGLFRKALPNGAPVMIWPKIPVTRGFDWGPHGTILVATRGRPDGGDLYLLDAEVGSPTLVEVPGLKGGFFSEPEFLPGGKDVLFAWEHRDDHEAGTYLATLINGKVVRGPFLLRKNMTAGRYSPAGGGRLLYVQDDKLYAQKLSTRRGTLEDQPQLVVEGVYSDVVLRRASFSVSRNGVLTWRAGKTALAQLTWFDREGRILGTAGPPCDPSTLRLSPDEKHVILHVVADRTAYSIVEQNRSGYLAILGAAKHPMWMPDGAHILLLRQNGASASVLERAAEGGSERELARLPRVNTLRDISPDGTVLLYKVALPRPTLYYVRLGGQPGSATPQAVAESNQGRFSPDGRWIVYPAQTTGIRQELFVQPFPSGGLRTQITTDGGDTPIWRGDGKEILYRNGSTLYSIRVDQRGNGIRASKPEALFKVRVPAGMVRESEPLALTRDGSRILFTQAVEQPDPPVSYVMTAWNSRLNP